MLTCSTKTGLAIDRYGLRHAQIVTFRVQYMNVLNTVVASSRVSENKVMDSDIVSLDYMLT